jgi:hypothetical protein
MPTYPTTLIAPGRLIAQCGRLRKPIDDLRELSRAYRATIDELGLGGSETPNCYILNEVGKRVGRVSYNGRVWKGEDWSQGDVPVYCPRMEG